MSIGAAAARPAPPKELARPDFSMLLPPDQADLVASLPGISADAMGRPVILGTDESWKLAVCRPDEYSDGTAHVFIFDPLDTVEPDWAARKLRVSIQPDGCRHVEVGDEGDWILHCPFAPAVLGADGSYTWYLEGKMHRVDGPALFAADGSKSWLYEGQHHREDGPAKEHPDGSREWLVAGLHHRLNGPAVENADGSFSWHRKGLAHREGGPAIRDKDGSESWWIDGDLHREDGPAITDADGSRFWWLNNARHREDGPAVMRADGTVEWWLEGEQLTRAQWRQRMGLPLRDAVAAAPSSVAAAMRRR